MTIDYNERLGQVEEFAQSLDPSYRGRKLKDILQLIREGINRENYRKFKEMSEGVLVMIEVATGLDRLQILSRSRKRPLPQARALFVHELLLKGGSPTDISRVIGRDRSTVYHAQDNIYDDLRLYHKDWIEALEELKGNAA